MADPHMRGQFDDKPPRTREEEIYNAFIARCAKPLPVSLPSETARLKGGEVTPEDVPNMPAWMGGRQELAGNVLPARTKSNVTKNYEGRNTSKYFVAETRSTNTGEKDTMDVLRKYCFQALGMLLVALLFSLGMDVWGKYRDEGERKRITEDNNLLVATATARATAAEIMARIPKAPSQVPAGSFNCHSEGAKANGYHEQRIHSLPLTADNCLWVAVTQPVTSVTGKDFLIEFPNPSNPATSYKCPTLEVPDCVGFFKYFMGNNFRVLTKAGGYVTINTTN